MRPTLFCLALFGALASAAGAASADRLVQPRELVSGGYYGPRFAPDGRHVLISGPRQRGLFLAATAGGAIRRLNDEPAAGVHARFRADGSIQFRALRAGARRDLVLALDGSDREAPSAAELAVVRDERVFVRGAAGALVQVGSGDRFFGERVSPDGDKVAFQGLATGLHVYTRSTARLVHVGPGTAPAWSPDSARLVYELTEDDGHDIVAADLHVFDLATGRRHQLTATEGTLERRPGFSPDGREVAFDDDTGRVWIARLEVQP